MGMSSGAGNGLMGKISPKGTLDFLVPHARIMANEMVLPTEMISDSSWENPRVSMMAPNPIRRSKRSMRSPIAWKIPG
jgi:hypothetical protein